MHSEQQTAFATAGATLEQKAKILAGNMTFEESIWLLSVDMSDSDGVETVATFMAARTVGLRRLN
jgi:hypothetical protein